MEILYEPILLDNYSKINMKYSKYRKTLLCICKFWFLKIPSTLSFWSAASPVFQNWIFFIGNKLWREIQHCKQGPIPRSSSRKGYEKTGVPYVIHDDKNTYSRCMTNPLSSIFDLLTRTWLSNTCSPHKSTSPAPRCCCRRRFCPSRAEPGTACRWMAGWTDSSPCSCAAMQSSCRRRFYYWASH